VQERRQNPTGKGDGMKPEYQAAFAELRQILDVYRPHLVTVHDSADNYYLDAAYVQPNGKPLYFGSVRVGKQYVSFHLMPVYLWPELLVGISDPLRKRLQGKSCFNFRKPEPELFAELVALTRAGFQRYRDHGYVS
jgi:hypothetical protein